MALWESFASLWEAVGDLSPEATAVVLGERRISWRQLDDRAARLAGALGDLGVGRGTSVAQLLYNCPEYLETVYAAYKLRACPVNVNYRYLADEVAHVLRDSDSEVLVFHASRSAEVDAARARLPRLRVLVQVEDGESPSPLQSGALRYEDLLAAGAPAPRIPRGGDDVFLMYTGGTTGLPKGVVWRHGDMLASLAYLMYSSAGLPVPQTLADFSQMAAGYQAAGTSPVHLIAPPLMHGTAMSLATATFGMGGTVVLLAGRRFDPDELLTLLGRERASQLTFVGDAFARPLVDALERAERAGRPYDLSSLQRITSTGATFSAPLKRALAARRPVLIVDVVAASEGGPLGMSVTPPGVDPPDTAVFLATDRTVLVDPLTMAPVPAGSGRSGALAVSGVVPLGYYNDPVRTAEVFREVDGVRYSVPGDIATIDADGTLHLLGRGSASVNTAGEKVYPEEVEVAARAHPGVLDCVVVGTPDPRLGEAVTLVASRTPGTSAQDDDVAASLRRQLAAYKVPRRVVWVPEVPRSPAGKADYRWARAAATAHLTLDKEQLL